MPVITQRLASSDPRVVTAAAAACLALAELAPRLRVALAGAGALPLLMAGITGAAPTSAALCVRALWALLQDNDVWYASERALRAEARIGDVTAASLIHLLHLNIGVDESENHGEEGLGSVVRADDGIDDFLGDGTW